MKKFYLFQIFEKGSKPCYFLPGKGLIVMCSGGGPINPFAKFSKKNSKFNCLLEVAPVPARGLIASKYGHRLLM